MRGILFRGKDVRTNEWRLGSIIIEKDGSYKIVADARYLGLGTTYCKVIKETISRFTYLIDKNGRLIFNGDILLVEGCHNGVVVFNEGDSLFAIKTKTNTIGLNNTCKEFVEVIGNIYDNPELLKEISVWDTTN